MATDSEDDSGSSDGGSSVVSEDDTGSSEEDHDESDHDESSQSSGSRDDDAVDDDIHSTSSQGEDQHEDDDDLPVGIKLQRQREAGVDMRDSRKRKAIAKEVASERLKSVPQEPRRRKDGATSKVDPAKEKQKAKKKSKHAPTEVSSKRSDFFMRQRMSNVNETGLGVTLAAGYRPKDPRLSSLTGHLDVDKFERNYAFLNEMRDREIVRLRQRVQAHQATGSKGRHLRRRLGMGRNPTTLEEDRAELKRLEQEKADRERQQIDRAARQAVKKRMHEEVEQGRKPHFVSRAKQRQLVLEAKYDELRKRKGDKAVEKAVAKRFKKDKSKLLLPREHP
jgi:ribosomal RNA-processing protein 36